MTAGPVVEREAQIYLASASPRRQQLLRQLDIAFEIVPAQMTEHPHAAEPARAYVQRLATAKARFAAGVVRERGWPTKPILGADTEVVLDGAVLGKPADAAHGRALLKRLAGRTHDVLTALALLVEGEMHTAVSESRVTFGELSDADVARYWATGEPADKAGGYAVQGRAGAFITRIEGSYSGIVGLPLYELAQLLRKVGVTVP